jgi:hypothetical protein
MVFVFDFDIRAIFGLDDWPFPLQTSAFCFWVAMGQPKYHHKTTFVKKVVFFKLAC